MWSTLVRWEQAGNHGTTSYGYDPVGRLTGIWAPYGESVTLAHDAGGRRTEQAFPNGVSTRYTYNANNTLAQVLTQLGSGTLTQHDYTYDGVGNRQTHIERIGETTTPYKYVYDPLDRLTEVRNNTTNALLVSYMHDPLGNRLSSTEGGATTYYFYNAANQVTRYCVFDSLCTTPDGTFTYDFNGNLASRLDGIITTTYAYDPENRLVWTGATWNFDQSYAYDDQGRRLRKVLGATATAVQYLYHGPDIVAEYDSTWVTPTARYTHGPGMDEPLLRTTATGSQSYHADGLGSLVALTNPDGSTAGTARYDAWGNRLAGTGTIPQYGYTGRKPDETGLIYYRARYYDPTLGRLTQRDPIGLQGGINPYLFVGGNPVNFTDPTGEWGVGTAIGGVLGAVGGADVGYRMGGWKGAVIGGLAGAGVGAAVGTFNPVASSTASTIAARMLVGAAVGGTTGAAGALATGNDGLVGGGIGAVTGALSMLPGVRQGGAAILGMAGNVSNQLANGTSFSDINPTSLWVAGASALVGKTFSQVLTSEVMSLSVDAAAAVRLLTISPLAVAAGYVASEVPPHQFSDLSTPITGGGFSSDLPGAQGNSARPDVLRDSYHSNNQVGTGNQTLQGVSPR